MKRHNMKAVLALVAAVLALLLRCSMGPTQVSDGTHTGNPDISATASALFDIMAAGDKWHVTNYIDSIQLDPSYIEPDNESDPTAPYTNALAKRATPTNSAGVDTVLIFDTLYTKDTTVNQYTRSDTIDTVVGADTVVYVNTWIVRDTMLEIDTVPLVDTLIITDSYGKNTQGIDTTASKSDTTVGGDSVYNLAPEVLDYSMNADSTRNAIQQGELSGDRGRSRNLTPLGAQSDVMGRSGFYSTPSGVSVIIEYIDADGDSLLLKSAAGGVPHAMLRERRMSKPLQMYLSARFNAGPDSDFPSRSDNTLLSLVRYYIEGEDTVETVLYETSDSSDIPPDSMVCTCSEKFVSDSIFSRKTRFSISAGEDKVASGDDKLAALAQTLLYRRGEVDKISVSMIPDSPLEKGETMGVSEFEAVMIFADGDTTRMNGTVGLRTGISAEYTDSSGTRNVKVSIDREVELEDK